MAMLDRHEPTAGELRWFGLMLAAFAAVVGGIVLYASASLVAAGIIWVIGLLLAAVYYGVPPTRYLLFRGWMALFFPLGWLISHLLIAAVYFLLVTPVALVMKLIGRDVLGKRPDPAAKSYWTRMETKQDSSRYFQQF